MTAFDDLMAHTRETMALSQVAGRLAWDQEKVMPRGAAEQRGEEMAAMEAVLHARRTDPRVGEWLYTIRPERLDDAGRAQIRLIARAHDRASKVPARLAAEIARATSVAQGVWAEARAQNDVGRFLPTLDGVVRLKREEAAHLANGGDLYDALLDDYEPGMTGAQVEAMFAALRPRLVGLRERILGSDRRPAPLSAHFDGETQLALARQLAGVFGYDWTTGRLDRSVHPFSSGSGTDCRITTRVAEHDPFNCIYSTIHEVGHATYEQGIDRAFLLTPVGQGVSMGVHESQSRIYENQLGRSRPFTGWLFGRMRELFGDFGLADADAFHATVNRVAPGFIRTEADEVHYNLHILMRFDLERALIAGRIETADMEEAWNARFAQDFGVAVDIPAHGMLQDVHWSVGLFGYFPTYTLGNLYAGCLHAALRRDLPDLDAALAVGDTRPATAWLREKVQRHGGLHAPAEVIARATGAAPEAGPLLDYLETKFGTIYGL
jgi:carboxypeptidase Taq